MSAVNAAPATDDEVTPAVYLLKGKIIGLNVALLLYIRLLFPRPFDCLFICLPVDSFKPVCAW